jgi:hydrogenase expression/formation protein HypD
VTPVELIDAAVALAARPGVTLCSFGDMLRVPGTGTDLLTARARGGDVRMVYSPLDAVNLAARQPSRQVVFFAVGFETPAPANAWAVLQAHRLGLKNFSLLVSHVLVPPAIEAILSSPDNRVQGFLAAGHVCTVMGTGEYGPLAARFHVPIVVTGFEPVDILQGVLMCVDQLETGRAEVANAYARAVRAEGNVHAQRVMREVFTVVDRNWRGIGRIPASGFALRPEFAEFDAARRFGVGGDAPPEATECISGQIMRGIKKPHECAAFGIRCTPEHPLGAPMVSSEGACAAYYRYRLRKTETVPAT